MPVRFQYAPRREQSSQTGPIIPIYAVGIAQEKLMYGALIV